MQSIDLHVGYIGKNVNGYFLQYPLCTINELFEAGLWYEVYQAL